MRTTTPTAVLFALCFHVIACTRSSNGSPMPSPQGQSGAAVSEAGTLSRPPPAGHGGAPAAGSGKAGAGPAAAGRGAPPAAGRGGAGSVAGSSAVEDAGTAGDECPKDLVLPAICRTCSDGSCGLPVCKDGKFSGDYRCPSAPAPDCSCKLGGTAPVCGVDGKNYDAICGRSCVPVAIACDGQCPCASSGLRWYMTCGEPVCRSNPDPSDDPKIPNCSGQKLGDPCQKQGELCDGVASCGAKWICASSDPTMGPGGCPISRARFKEQVEYLDAAQRRAYRDQLLRMPLASYRYQHAPEAGPQLGFMIDDVEPSVAVSGDHVNMYGYLSMAVAAIQEQQQQIEALQTELEQLRASSPSGAQAVTCEPRPH